MEVFLAELLSGYGHFSPFLFVFFRSLAVIIPPIPGVAIDLVGIVTFPWFLGFLYAEAGIMAGAMMSFFIARRFRERVVKTIVPMGKISEWEDRLSEHKKFWGLVLLRIPTMAFFDYLSYAAGLTRIGGWKFFWATLLGNIPGMLLFYYFGGLFFRGPGYYLVSGVAIILILLAMWRGKDILALIERKKN